MLQYLAATQAQETDDARDAEPGKIIHEARRGEMAALNEIPFGAYYGTADATPLFIVLAGQYHARSADREFTESIWPAVVRALDWIDLYGDADHDGFVEYLRRSENGLRNQGWKDSEDAIFHADGSLAEGAIALCEVQGYVYQAKLEAAKLAAALGKDDLAADLDQQAQELKKRFDQVFWIEELGCYAQAIDGSKQRCSVRTSNAGHALFSGIAAPARARLLARRLLDAEFFSGWGVRTVSTAAPRYNPIGYHNGTVWPHDNAMLALGLSRYGFVDGAARITGGMFEAALHLELQRLPELFCGFEREPDIGPTFYPVACSPQAWAAGAVFMLLQACLGLSIDAVADRVEFRRPRLPAFVPQLRIERLRVGASALDITCRQYQGDVAINVDKRSGDTTVAIFK